MAAARPLPVVRSSPAPRGIGAVVAVLLHVLAGAALLTYAPSREVLFAAVPIMVDLIAPPKLETKPEPPVEIKPKPKPRPRRAVKPVIRKPDPPPPVVTAPVEGPTPVVAESPPPPAPPPAPAPAPIIATPPPVTAPVFSAEYLQNPSPAYPTRSRRLGEQGRVVLRVLVTPEGGTQEVQVCTSSGHARLDEAASETVRGWRFVPARRGEQPVAAWVLIPISFRLEG